MCFCFLDKFIELTPVCNSFQGSRCSLLRLLARMSQPHLFCNQVGSTLINFLLLVERQTLDYII